MDIKDLTSGEVAGDGSIETILRTVTSALDEKINKNSLTEEQATAIYSTTLPAVMQVALDFTLSKDKATNEADLIAAQIRNMDADTKLKDKELEKIEVEISIANEQLLVMKQQVLNSKEEVELTKAKVKKTDADTNLVKQQEEQSVSQTKVIDRQWENLAKDGLLLDENLNKAKNESKILEYKSLTEYSQTHDNMPDGTDVGGLMKHQIALAKAQADGFTTNSLIKTFDSYLSTWNVRASAGEALTAPAGLADDDIMAVGNALRANLGISLAT